MKIKTIVFLLISALLQGCTAAPFSNHYSARSIGKNKFSLNAGYENGYDSVIYLRGGYGASENFDLGAVMEAQFFDVVLGGFARYAFLNQQKGLSINLEGGVGGSSLSSYAYIGPAIGYKLKWWEPYLIARYNYVHYDDNIVFDFGYLGKYCIHNKGAFDYGSFTLGQTFWFKEWLGLNLNMNVLTHEMSSTFFGGGLILTF